MALIKTFVNVLIAFVLKRQTDRLFVIIIMIKTLHKKSNSLVV